jgi:hypothetical protein
MNWSTDSNNGCRHGLSRRSGFSLVELVFTSSISLVLILVLFEALLFCRRSAAHMRCRLAADTYAFDVAWDVFNRQTRWFDNNADNPTNFPATWTQIQAARAAAFAGISTNDIQCFLSVRPNGTPITSWEIVTDVRWRQPNGGWVQLPQPYRLERHRVNRNYFRNAP